MNQDCWDLVLAQVDPHDYPTLCALLTVCRASFLVTVRVLYKDPFAYTENRRHSSFVKDEVDTPFQSGYRGPEYSDFSRDRLEWILSRCSGNTAYWKEFAKRKKWPRVKIRGWWEETDDEEFWNTEDKDEEDEKEMDGIIGTATTPTTTTSTMATTNLPPMTTINYYDICRRIDSQPFKINKTFGYVYDDPSEHHQVIHIRFHAEKLHELDLSYRLIPEVLPFVDRLSSLKKLKFEPGPTEEATAEEEILAKRLIKLHQEHFPGLLEAVDVTHQSLNWDAYISLNRCLRNINLENNRNHNNKLCRGIEQQQLRVRTGPLAMFTIPGKDCDLLKIPGGRLKTLSVNNLDYFNNTTLRTGKEMQILFGNCKMLENLKWTLCPRDGFQWAAKDWEKLEQERRMHRWEREERQRRERRSALLLQYPNWSLYDSTQWWRSNQQCYSKDDYDDEDDSRMLPGRLMPLMHLDLTGEADGLSDAMRSFSSTLETIYYSQRPAPWTPGGSANRSYDLNPTWIMPRLKSLTLIGVKINFQEFFKTCPVLEVFKCSHYMTFEQPFWKAPTTIRQLDLSGDVSLHFDPSCIRYLNNLEDLRLYDFRNGWRPGGQLPDPNALPEILPMENVGDWAFPRLKKLALLGIWASRFQGLLVAKSPRLESLDIGGSMMLRRTLDLTSIQLPLGVRPADSKLKNLTLSGWIVPQDELAMFEGLFIDGDEFENPIRPAPMFPNLEDVQLQDLTGVDHTKLAKGLLRRSGMKRLTVMGMNVFPHFESVDVVQLPTELPYKYRSGEASASGKKEKCVLHYSNREYVLRD